MISKLNNSKVFGAIKSKGLSRVAKTYALETRTCFY
jgi:hypothetical protein